MLLANIVPVSLIDELPQYNAAHLALSNVVAKHSDYAKFYRQMALDGQLVILDSPVHENVPFDEDQWLYAMREIMRPTVVVIPDVIDSSDETIKNAAWLAHHISRSNPRSMLMGVPHGFTVEEFVKCAEQLVDVGASWLGVSLERRLNDDRLAVQNREAYIRALKQNSKTRKCRIHLLGISEQATELRNPFLQAVCESVDASKFAVWFLTGNPAVPPVPLSQEYPGREALGGSMGYFDWKPALGNYPHALRGHLGRWCSYADLKAVQ